MLRFSHPHFLLLLPLVWAYTLWVMRRSLADLGRERGRLAAGLRLLLLTLLVLALAGMQLVRPTHTLCTIFVVDRSDSVAHSPQAEKALFAFINAARKTMRQGDQFALVAFGAEALLDRAPEEFDARAQLSSIISTPSSSRTDIAAGIQLAMASFPQESGKQIVLFSDGNENLGSALDQTALAVSSDVRISVVPLARDLNRGEALLRHMAMPREVKEGAPFQISVVAEALTATDGTVTLYRNNEAVETRAVHLKPGATIITFEQTVPKGGLFQYRAALNVQAGADTIADNNTATAFTRVAGKPKVLVVENVPGDGAPLAAVLKAHQVQVVTGGPDAIPASLAECAQYDSVLFANVPAWRMSPAQMSILRAAVRDTGMGFAMVGGDESFGAGGYYKTAIEEALPVTMEMKKQKTLPSMTLVIVIDVSGSMGMTEGGVMKIRLAAEAAMTAVDLLQPIDQVCVMGFDTDKIEVVKLTRVGEGKSRIMRQIEKLQPGGGGILIKPALDAAYQEIRGANTAVKHVIVCADAADTEIMFGSETAECMDTARKMRREKISLSVIGFGTRHDPHVPLQQQIAKANSGNWYLAERMSNLPQIFSRDVMYAAKSLLVEEPFRPLALNTAHPIMGGIGWESAPPLRGYVATSFREGAPSARLLLKSNKDDPVLAAWTYGLGRSVAFTSDASAHWAVNWLAWEGYPAFWTQAMRWTLRQVGTANFQTTVQEQQGRATVVVEAVTKEGEFRNLLDLRAHVAHVAPTGPDGPQTTEELVTLEQTAPGRYEASFETRKIGPYVVTVEERNQKGEVVGTQMSTLVIPYSPEFQHVTPNRALLSQLAERAKGVVDPKAAEIFGRLRFGSRTLQDLWPLLLLVLTLLFMLDITVRRVLLPWREVMSLLGEAIQRRLPAWTSASPAPAPQRSATVGPLLGTKSKVARPAPAETATTARLREMRESAHLAAPSPTAPTPTVPTSPAPAVPPPPHTPPPAAPASTAGKLLQKKRERGGK